MGIQIISFLILLHGVFIGWLIGWPMRKQQELAFLVTIPMSLVDSDGKPVRSLGAQAARLPQAGVWRCQTPTL
jgi:hypothetical protein